MYDSILVNIQKHFWTKEGQGRIPTQTYEQEYFDNRLQENLRGEFYKN